MNKKVLALAVAAAIASPLAMAETTLYGSFDVSIDHIQQPQGDKTANPVPPTVNQSTNQISSNISWLGVRGSHNIGPNLKGVYQVETEVNITGTPGYSDLSKNQFGSRNSFVGIASPAWGAFKIGKNDTPYKTSTANMDPFSRTVGDYNAIMGNTGGDNRVEFDIRTPHAAWYESPKFAGGLQLNVLVSPGQHLNGLSSDIAQGEGKPGVFGLCTGGNTVGINADSGPSCQDGGTGTIWSAAANYSAGPIYATAAYELHKDVDRVQDDFGNAGIRDEHAYKVGAAYDFGTNRLAAIYEKLARNNAAPGSTVYDLAPGGNLGSGVVPSTVGTGPNATSGSAGRNRSGYFISDVQKLPGNNEIMASWTHAGKSDRPDGFDDSANLLAVGARHHFSKWMSVYAVYAEDKNKDGGHYGLGQSGHGIQVNPSGTAGQTFKAFSVGSTVNF